MLVCGPFSRARALLSSVVGTALETVAKVRASLALALALVLGVGHDNRHGVCLLFLAFLAGPGLVSTESNDFLEMSLKVLCF